MSLIIYGHPRSRTNLICSHIDGFPAETFDLTRLSKNLTLDWSQIYDVRENIYTGNANLYLEKLKKSPPEKFKIFGFHLHNWPDSYSFIRSLNYPVIRVYRRKKFDAILSALLANRRGWTSQTQKEVDPFDVTLRQFTHYFNSIVIQDAYWEKCFNFDMTIEYDDVPELIQSGTLEKFGVSKKQIYPLADQNSSSAAQDLITNYEELIQWNELMCKDAL